MTTTAPTRPAHRLTDLVDGVRAAVAVHADWAETGDETAISIHVYGTDVTRIGGTARRCYD